MSIISRPTKEGGATSYTGKIALGHTKILAAEADADLDALYAAWNAGADTVNIKDNAVTTAKLANSQVTTAKLANTAVTLAKIAAGASVRGVLLANVTAGLSVINDATETTIAQFASFTSGGGWIEFGGAWNLQYTPLPSTTAYYVLRLYRDSTVIQRIRLATTTAGATVDSVAPIPSWIEQPGAGGYVYKVTMQIVANQGLVGAFNTPAADPGTLWLRETA